MNYKIILADDHQFLMEGIASVLNDMPGVEVIARATDGSEAISLVQKHLPDLLIMDLNMPVLDGIEALKILKKSHTALKIIILTNYQQEELVEEVKQAGADGFLVKNSTAEELKKIIKLVLEGYKIFPSETGNTENINDRLFPDDFLKKYQLTPRELDIIMLINKEMSSREIAQHLFLSEFTVQTHRRNIFKKIDVRNVAGLINFSKQHNLM
ncbi:MAG: response regulator transcription factor [Ferruginibacter sp.]